MGRHRKVCQVLSTVAEANRPNLPVDHHKQDRTIGGTKLDYMPDEYAPGRRLDRELKAKARTMISKPFLAMGRTGKGIVPIVNYLGGGWLQGAVRGCRVW